MAILKSLEGPEVIVLKPVHIFGRDPNVADLVLDNDVCSRMHCVIRYQNGHWFVTDESTNGCFINGKRLDKGQSTHLSSGDVLSTGANMQWRVENDRPPVPTLLSDTNTDFVELRALNILPNEQNPECQILKQGKEWFFEKDHDMRQIEEGFSFPMAGHTWHFFPNAVLQETEFLERTTETPPSLTFYVSRDEENVGLAIEVNGVSFDLGNKTHHYLLLEMARHLKNDPAESAQERGWMSNMLLLHNLRIDINHLNIQIYRAREAIRKCSVYWGQHLIERRRGEIRLAPCVVNIHKEGL